MSDLREQVAQAIHAQYCILGPRMCFGPLANDYKAAGAVLAVLAEQRPHDGIDWEGMEPPDAEACAWMNAPMGPLAPGDA